jgi:hypothetical protein
MREVAPQEVVLILGRDLRRLRGQVISYSPPSNAGWISAAWAFASLGAAVAVPLAGYYHTAPRQPLAVEVILWCLIAVAATGLALSLVAARKSGSASRSWKDEIASQIDALPLVQPLPTDAGDDDLAKDSQTVPAQSAPALMQSAPDDPDRERHLSS